MSQSVIQNLQHSRQALHELQRRVAKINQSLTSPHTTVRYLSRRKPPATPPKNPMPEPAYRDPKQCDRYDVWVPGLLAEQANTDAHPQLTEQDAKSLTVSLPHKTLHLAGSKVQLRLTRQHDELSWYAVCPHCKAVTDTITAHPAQNRWRCPTCLPNALHDRLARKAAGPIAAAAHDLPRHPNPYVQARALSSHLQAVRKQALIVASDVSRVQQALANLENRVQDKLRQQVRDEIDFERVTYHRHAWSRAAQGATDVPSGMRRYFDALARRANSEGGADQWPSEQDLLSRQRTYVS